MPVRMLPQLLRYYLDFLRLVIHAGTVWGITVSSSVDDWAAEVLASPLKYELIALNDRRVKVCGTAFGPLRGQDAR
jgi:hypothetical protein